MERRSSPPGNGLGIAFASKLLQERKSDGGGGESFGEKGEICAAAENRLGFVLDQSRTEGMTRYIERSPPRPVGVPPQPLGGLMRSSPVPYPPPAVMRSGASSLTRTEASVGRDCGRTNNNKMLMVGLLLFDWSREDSCSCFYAAECARLRASQMQMGQPGVGLIAGG